MASQQDLHLKMVLVEFYQIQSVEQLVEQKVEEKEKMLLISLKDKLVMLKIVQMLLLKTQNGKTKVALPVNGQIELLELLEWQQYMT